MLDSCAHSANASGVRVLVILSRSYSLFFLSIFFV